MTNLTAEIDTNFIPPRWLFRTHVPMVNKVPVPVKQVIPKLNDHHVSMTRQGCRRSAFTFASIVLYMQGNLFIPVP